MRRLASGHDAGLSGLTTTAKAVYSVLLWQTTAKPLIIVVDGSKQAELLSEAVGTLFGLLAAEDRNSPQLIPSLDVLPMQNLSPHAEICEERAIGLWRLATQKVPITILPIGSALLRVEPASYYRQLALKLKVGDELPLDEVILHLESVGYERREPVEMVGEYSLRGGILDVFSPESGKPVRIDLFGDQVESMRRFDVESQRSVLKIEDCTILPLTEHQKSRGLLVELGDLMGQADIPGRDLPPPGEAFAGWELLVPMVRPRNSSVFSLVDRPLVVWDEPQQVKAAANRVWTRLEQVPTSPAYDPDRIFFRWEDLERQVAAPSLSLEQLEIGFEQRAGHISTRPAMSFHGNMQVAIAEARTLVEQGNRVAFFASSNGEVERVADILNEYSVPYQLGLEQFDSPPAYLAERAYMSGTAASIYLVKGLVRHGTSFQDSKLVVFGSEDLFETSEMVARAPSVEIGAGDFFGRSDRSQARRLCSPCRARRRAVSGPAGDRAGRNQGRLHAPGIRRRRQALRPAHPHGPGAALPRRGRGQTGARPHGWRYLDAHQNAHQSQNARHGGRAFEALRPRKMTEGFQYSPDSNWQREFEDAFEFTETRDQLNAIQEIKRDMEGPQPMDRLLCGDVGFGKTEVVMRATFKALGDGKQVAVLAPTTVLAFQHFETFKRRFQPFPVRVEMFSRFRTAQGAESRLADLAEGKVDIAIGTHRLLSQDVEFRDLGLVIVDEEQRFGVKHKERLKQLKKAVDVVTMSATPIPRTLHMSLLGLRDMSVIETPPKDRLSIHTVVAPFQPEIDPFGAGTGAGARRAGLFSA